MQCPLYRLCRRAVLAHETIKLLPADAEALGPIADLPFLLETDATGILRCALLQIVRHGLLLDAGVEGIPAAYQSSPRHPAHHRSRTLDGWGARHYVKIRRLSKTFQR